MQFLFVLVLLFAVLVATFALQNAYPVTIYFLKWKFEASFGLVILVCLLIGAVSLGSLSLVHQASSKLKARADGKNGKQGQPGESGQDEQDAPPQAADHRGTVNEPGGVDDSSQEVED